MLRRTITTGSANNQQQDAQDKKAPEVQIQADLEGNNDVAAGLNSSRKIKKKKKKRRIVRDADHDQLVREAE